MNKRKNYLSRREILNQIKYSSLSGNKEGYFYAYSSETDEHIDKKYLVWKKLKKAGYKIWCEPIFNSGIRMDILAFKEGIWTNYEILSSETEKEFAKKIEKYPEINIIKIKTDKDIENLEMF
ncbi:MAG TPA: hypothetical protein VGB37_12790 [Candidatus Lokiarchaeia archaeon]